MERESELQAFGDEPERAHGGIVRVDGHRATLADGTQWWLVNEQWALAEALTQMHCNPNRRLRA